jgi:cation/acetate symporter
VFISLTLTGHVFPQIGLGSTLVGTDTHLLDALDKTMTELGFGPYTERASQGTMNMFLLTLSLMIGTAGLPHVIVRFFTVPKMADARSSAGWALVFIALLYTVAPAVAAMAIYNMTNTIQPGPVGSPDGNVVYEERPDWMKRWQDTRLLAFADPTSPELANDPMYFQDKNGDGRIQYYNDKNPEMAAQAETFGWKGNELGKIDNDIMVLANPEIARLPNWVTALVAAGAIAAALSTAAGLLLAIASAISHDLLKGMIAPKISPETELLAARIAMGFAIVLAGYLGLNPPGFAAQVVALAFGLAAASLFPTLMMGIFSKRINKEGAIAGMLVGVIVTSVYVFLYKGWFFIPGTAPLPDTPDGWFFGINPLGFGVIGAILNFVTAYLVSSVTAAPPKQIQDLVESVRIPRAQT